MELSGRTALITGAGRRLGRAFALALAEHGADVAIHYHTAAEGAAEVAALAREHGVRAATLPADLGDPEQAAALVPRAADELGAIELLVNSASIFERTRLAETDLESWQRNLAINLTAPYLLCRALADQHRASGGAGAIVNLLDWRALRPTREAVAYTVAKAGLAALTRSLAQELAPDVRVNGLALGAILPAPGETEVAPAILARVPAGRTGTVGEVVAALLFLLGGPEYITGEVLHLDGGRQLT